MQFGLLKRREFITLLGGAATWPLGTLAQAQGKVWRVGVLSIGSASTASHLGEAFFKAMADLGYQEGRNVRYEVRYGEAASTSSSSPRASWSAPTSI
jgi:putative ABC transport system substrate-binding protein